MARTHYEVLDQEVGWHRLLRIKPELESMVEDNEASPLTLAAEQYATVNKYAGAFLGHSPSNRRGDTIRFLRQFRC